MEPPKDVSVAIKWQGKLFSVTLAADADVGSLKRLIEAETNVLPARQKLLNVKVGPKMADDAAPLSTVKLPKVVMMMGSTEAAITSISVAAEAAPEVLDDFDVRDDDPIDVKDKP
jgi:ubiquitin-like domain-containing CTD phosphatase 1